MKINVKPEDSLLTRIFREGKALGDLGRVIESVDVTQDEYKQLTEETGARELASVLGAPLLVDGIRVPNTFERIMAQAEAQAEKEAGVLPN